MSVFATHQMYVQIITNFNIEKNRLQNKCFLKAVSRKFSHIFWTQRIFSENQTKKKFILSKRKINSHKKQKGS